MRRIMLFCAAATSVATPLAVFSSAASAPASRRAPTPATGLSLTPKQFIEARRAAFRLSAADIQLIRTAGEKGADMRMLSRPAQTLSQWATVLPTLFPAGTGPESGIETRALPAIWANRADFEQRARDYSAAATRLSESLAAGDFQASAQNWDATWQSCSACHIRYRAGPP